MQLRGRIPVQLPELTEIPSGMRKPGVEVRQARITAVAVSPTPGSIVFGHEPIVGRDGNGGALPPTTGLDWTEGVQPVLESLRAHEQAIAAADYSSDGRLLFTAG